METREQMERRLRMEAEIRRQIDTEEREMKKKTAKKRSAKSYFIGLAILLIVVRLIVGFLNWMDPGSISMTEPFVLYFCIPIVVIIYTLLYFCVDAIFIGF